MNIFGYIKRYGKFSFTMEPFNEVDNVILSCISYVDFLNIVSKGSFVKRRLEDVAKEYFSNNTKRDNKKNISEVRTGIKLLYEVWHTKRYRDILMFNYMYVGSSSTQFSAISFEYMKNYVYVAFQGTDELLSGWEEDFKIAYSYPVPAQRYAINYLKRKYLLSHSNFILGGHSKGGHLATIALMEAPTFLSKKIVYVYSNDGLGLRKEEYYSKKYQRIKDKIVKIIPDYSVVGVILQYDTNYMVVKSKTKRFFAHNPKGWLIEDNHFLNTRLTRFSLVIKEGMSRWLDSYTYREKHDFACSIFDLARKYKFKSLLDFKKRKLDFFRMVASSKNVDEKTKEMAKRLVSIIRKCNKEYKEDL